MEEQAGRDLSAEELAAVPEVSILPDGARILYTKAIGTYDGARDDNLDPSAVFDCFYVCPGQFHDIVRWVAGRLAARGWPAGTEVTNGSLPWHMWTRAKDQISLIDFTTSDWT